MVDDRDVRRQHQRPILPAADDNRFAHCLHSPSFKMPTWMPLGRIGERWTLCVAVMKSLSSAWKMLGTYFCGLRSASGNQVLHTCTMIRCPFLNVCNTS